MTAVAKFIVRQLYINITDRVTYLDLFLISTIDMTERMQLINERDSAGALQQKRSRHMIKAMVLNLPLHPPLQ